MKKPNDRTFIARVEIGNRLTSIIVPSSAMRAVLGLNPRQNELLEWTKTLYGIAIGDTLQLHLRKPDLCIPPLALDSEAFVPLDEIHETTH